MSVTIPAEQRALAKRHEDDKEFIGLVEALDASSTEECVECGQQLGGLLGSFRWGIQNGHGECAACGYPYVYYHRHELEPAAYYQGREVAPAKELVLMAWIPGAEMPLATTEQPS